MADESVVLDVLIELKEEGLEVARLVSNQLADLNDEVKDLNKVLKINMEQAHDDAAALLELAGAATVAKGATGGGGILGMVGALAQLMPGGTAMGYAILGVVGLAAVLTPLSYAFLAVTANVVAWTAIAAIAVPAITGLAGAIFLLGAANAGGLNPAAEMIKTQKALETAVKEHAAAVAELQQVQAGGGAQIYGSGLSQQQMLKIARAYVGVTGDAVSDAQRNLAEPLSGLGGPIASLGTALDSMHDHFEVASRSLADHIALWVTGFIPAIQTAGDAVLKWFGERWPAIMALATPLAKDFGGFLASIFTTVGKVVDYFLAHSKEVESFWKAFLGGGAAAFDGFMNAMINVADWFRKNWPAISKAAGETWADIKKGWDAMWPNLKPALELFGVLLKDVVDHFGDLRPLLPVIGAELSILTGVIISAAAPLLLMAEALERIVAAGTWVVAHWGQLQGASGGSLPGAGGRYGAGGAGSLPGAQGPTGGPITGSGGGSAPGARPQAASYGGATILPVVFSPIPPNQAQILVINDALRRLNKSFA